MAILNRADMLVYLGKGSDATDAEIGFLLTVQPMVERAVKRFVGYSIEQASHTHYLPTADRGTDRDAMLSRYDVQGQRAVAQATGLPQEASYLVCPEVPIRSVTGVWEDTSAYAGQGSDDFASGTELTAGTHYWRWELASGLCKSGILVRVGTAWPSRPGTVKVTYTAGYTQAELSTGIAADVKLACLEAIQAAFARRGVGGGGSLKSERIGRYAATYGVPEEADRLPKAVKKRLRPFIHYWRLM